MKILAFVVCFPLAAFLYLNMGVETLTCNRAANYCKVEVVKPLQKEKEVSLDLPLSLIKNAQVTSSRSSHRRKTSTANRRSLATHNVYLVVSRNEKEQVFGVSSNNVSFYKDSARKINAFLNSSEPSLEIVNSNKIVNVFFVIFLLIPIILLFSKPSKPPTPEQLERIEKLRKFSENLSGR